MAGFGYVVSHEDWEIEGNGLFSGHLHNGRKSLAGTEATGNPASKQRNKFARRTRFSYVTQDRGKENWVLAQWNSDLDLRF